MFKPGIPIVLLFALICLAFGKDNHHRIKVFCIDPSSLFQSLEKEGFDLLGKNRSKGFVELIASREELALLKKRKFKVQVVTPTSRGIPPGYRQYKDLVPLYFKAQSDYPAICQVTDAGATYGNWNTHENRPIYLIKISDNVKVDEDEPKVLFTLNRHAREIATAEYGVWIIEKLTSLYGIDPKVTKWVDENQIYIMPCMNPDGYQYCFDKDEWWRKNRTPVGGGYYGVDLNRNYDFHWDGPFGGSSSPSSITYRGPYVHSEQETLAETGFALSQTVLAKVMDFHSYGSEVLYTYPVSSEFPSVLESYMQSMAIKVADGFNYNGAHRKPSGEGEAYEWELCKICPFAFLVETGDEFQPPYSDTIKEFDDHIWPGVQAFLEVKIPLRGHVTQTKTNDPLQADLLINGVNYTEGEVRRSEPDFGRHYSFLPQGSYDVTFMAQGQGQRTVKATADKDKPSLLTTQLGQGPVLNVTGPCHLGGVLTLDFDWSAGAGHLYGNGVSLIDTGFFFPNGVYVPIGWDLVYQITLGLFPGWSGKLDAKGQASTTLVLPNDTAAAGLLLFCAYFTLDPMTLSPSAASVSIKVPIDP